MFIIKPAVFSYRFDPSLIQKYFCSQDIPNEPPCKRLFLSDGDIHISAGYLYAKGADPVEYNFQHPPFIKYLYGLSILIFNNPYFAQIGLGLLFLIATYLLSFNVFKDIKIALLACLFLITDPLFLNLSSNTLLDLGQGVFLLFYILLVLFHEKNYILQGIVLGLLLASKFWGGSLFFILVLTLYLLYKRMFNMKRYIYHLGIAFVVFCLVYGKSFIDKHGFFNIFFFELRTFKYWLQHSASTLFGSFIFLFLTGYFKSWWGNNTVIKTDTWSILWPFMFIISSIKSFLQIRKKKFNNHFLIDVFPLIYLLYLGVQTPFARYFILILPFFYMTFAQSIVSISKKMKF